MMPPVRRDLPSGTVTFLFTDVEGSTKLLHELGEEAYAEALAEHRRVIREACARHDGIEVDTQGDAFFFAFPTAPGAIAAAGEVTEAFASGPIQVRIGLHTGTPLLTEEGYVGGDVHRAARIAAAGNGGQVLVSSSTSMLVELELADLGEHRLKDIEEPVSILQLGHAQFPPLKTISNTNLPRPLSSFVGRDAELRGMLARIEGGARLLTLTGPGGSGKTRLALEAASSLIPEYKAGVFWVDLTALRDPALVIAMIAQTLGAKDGLAEHIGERRLLVMLDNLEQVIESAPELSSLLEGCPNLTLLVTSRERLRVRGEVEYPVPPLVEQEAVELFCERSGLAPSEETTELCARLDYLPLALELAAARTGLFSPSQLLERLGERLDLFKGGRDVDPRQQTLRATIEWSHDLLDNDEQRLFCSLSVFAGGCVYEAANAVAGADPDTLQSLLDKSLLRRRTDGADRPRYWMLETIREYAADRLESHGATGELRNRHLRFFVEWAERVEPELKRANQLHHLTELEADHDNLRAAVDHGARSGEPELAGRLAVALLEFWDAHCHFVEARQRFAAVLERRDEVSAFVTAEALRGAGLAAHRQSDQSEAFKLSLAAAEAHHRSGNLGGAALAHCTLTFVHLSRREITEAAQSAARSVSAARSDGDAWTMAQSLAALAAATMDQGHEADAQELFEQSLRLFDEAGDGRYQAIEQLNLGTVAVQRGSYERAEALLADAVDGARALQDIGTVAESIMELAKVALIQGRHPDARVRLREALLLGWRGGLRAVLSRCLIGVSFLAHEAGNAESAAHLVGSAEALLNNLPLWVSDELWELRLLEIRRSLGDQELDGIIDQWRQKSLDEMATEALEVLSALDQQDAD